MSLWYELLLPFFYTGDCFEMLLMKTGKIWLCNTTIFLHTRLFEQLILKFCILRQLTCLYFRSENLCQMKKKVGSRFGS